MGNFPEKWMDTATVGSYLRPPSEKRDVGRAASQFIVPAGLPPPTLPQWSPPQTGPSTVVPENASSGHGDRPVSICPTDIHPALKQLMSWYVTHFRSVQLRSLLRAARISEGDLPTIAKYMSQGKNGLCYAYILGKCQGKMCGKSPQGHAPATEISDDFAKELCVKLAPAVEHRLAAEPPMTQGQYGGGTANKQYKRTA